MKNKLIISGFFAQAHKRKKVAAIAAMRYQAMAHDKFREITNLSKLLN